jgi:3-oxoacyl-[acyl-carrier protein] reductase
MKLKDKNALITGAGQGIGKEIAIRMAEEGANIIIADINLETAEATAEEIKPLGTKCIAFRLDVSKEDEVVSLFETIKKEFGRLDILVNNAGITRDSLIMRMKDEDWEAVINVNLKGTFLCSKEAVKLMVKQQYGKIINISSVVAFMGNPGQVNYSASKAGIIGLTKTIAKEYATRGIRVNAVAPGFIHTSMTDAIPEKIKEEMKRSIPLGYFGTPSDVASAVIFLASEESDYITGQVLHINGGMYV